MKRVFPQDELSNFLENHPAITFALLFGSTSSGKTTPMSDVDVAIFTDRELDILELGRIIAGIENIVLRKVDCVILNDLYRMDPRFAFEIQSHAIPLFIKDNGVYIDYKRKVLLYYLDIKPMLDRMDDVLRMRIEQGKFGERNYA